MFAGLTVANPESTVLNAEDLPLTLMIAPGYTQLSAAHSRAKLSSAVTRRATTKETGLGPFQPYLITWYYGLNFSKL